MTTHQPPSKTDPQRGNPRQLPSFADSSAQFSTLGSTHHILALQRMVGNTQTRQLLQRQDDSVALSAVPTAVPAAPAEPPEVTARLNMLDKEFAKMITQARLKGWGVAADNLQHYFAGKGGTRTLKPSWLRRFDETKQAERTNQERFEKSLSELAAQLTDGETRAFNDYWDRLLKAEEGNELFYASGHSTITSTGSFSLTRSGDKVTISGTVQHHWHDPYDWHGGLFIPLPNGAAMTDNDLLLYQQYRGAATFHMEADWTQELTGEYKIVELWTDEAKYEWRGP